MGFKDIWQDTVRKNIERYRLTNREQQVVWYLLEGRTNGEIAYNLHIKEDTVKDHVWNICKKTQANGRLEVVLRILGIYEE